MKATDILVEEHEAVQFMLQVFGKLIEKIGLGTHQRLHRVMDDLKETYVTY